MLDTKHITTAAEWKADGPVGSLRAVISTFDVVDMDGDVVAATAFKDGQAVPMVWAHDWSRPIGKGVVRVEAKRAVFDGQLFMDTPDGQYAYNTIKGLAELQEYSWGFRILEAEPVTVNGQDARRITSTEVYEASPVLVGAAGRGRTRTLSLKDGLSAWAAPMSLTEHGEHALAGVRSYLGRVGSLADLRADEGRKRGSELSRSNRALLRALLDAFDQIGPIREQIVALLDRTDQAIAAETEADADDEKSAAPPPVATVNDIDADLVAIRDAHASRMARYGVLVGAAE